MKKKVIAFVPYIIVLAINFYILPFLIKDTGLGMIMLLGVIPLITFITAVIYGVRQGFNILFTVITAILFAPTIYIHYNETAWVYIIAYAIIALVGNAIGRIFYKK